MCVFFPMWNPLACQRGLSGCGILQGFVSVAEAQVEWEALPAGQVGNRVSAGSLDP